jgi:hypothetical protein
MREPVTRLIDPSPTNPPIVLAFVERPFSTSPVLWGVDVASSENAALVGSPRDTLSRLHWLAMIDQCGIIDGDT